MRRGTRSAEEPGFEPFKVAELLASPDRDAEALESAKQTDLVRVGRELTELSGIPQDHPDYLLVQRVVARYEELLDRAIDQVLHHKEDPETPASTKA